MWFKPSDIVSYLAVDIFAQSALEPDQYISWLMSFAHQGYIGIGLYVLW